MLTRPRGVAEWVWAASGAALLAIFGLVPLPDVARAISHGTDVYLFLAGMMLLAGLAKHEGVFDWAACQAVRAARGSAMRLFALVFGVGIVVTTVLSNDATAVVLTPAVADVVRKAKAKPLPYLFACAFIANAASFVLPISNPANLVVFGDALPSLPRWLLAFSLPSLFAIGATFAILAFISRRDLAGSVTSEIELPKLGDAGRIVLGGIGATALALVTTSAFNAPLGTTTAVCAVILLAISFLWDREAVFHVVRSVSWSVLVLVAGLFVLVQGLDATGLLTFTRRGIEALAAWPPALSVLAGSGITAIGSNLINNLAAGRIAGASLYALPGHEALRAAIAIGIDLGPNLSVTGSLATVLWLIALRREKIEISAWTFLRAGALVMPPALVLAALSILITIR